MDRFICWALACGLLAGLYSPAAGQVVIQNPQGGMAGPYVNPMGSSLQWLSGPQMEKELELVGEQREAIAKLRTEVVGRMQKLFDPSIPDAQDRMKKYHEAAQALAAETEKKVGEILLPHQVKRVRQIALQMRMQAIGYGGASAITAGEVAEELGLSDDQKSQLRDREKEVQADIRKKTQEFYQQLQQESRDRLLDVLTPAQKKKLEALLGEKFEWPAQSVGQAQRAG